MAKTLFRKTASKLRKTRILTRKAKPASLSAKPVPLSLLGDALKRHPRRSALVKAGAQKNQLLRALVPLYLVRAEAIEVSSGTISRFWKGHGVRFAPPNAAKAFRQHAGYAKRTPVGRQITATGVRYVEAAVKQLA